MMRKLLPVVISGLLLLAAGCGFEYSPYQASPSEENLNAKSIIAIKHKETSLTYPYSIALISDTHSYYDNYRSAALYVAANRDSYRFVLHSGDITETGLQKEFDWNHEFSTMTGLPVVTAVGNHDALSNGVFIYKKMYGPFDFSFSAANNHYIFWNNNNWEFGAGIPDWDWLESELAKAYAAITADGGQIYVVNHIPHLDAERYLPADHERYRNLMSSYGVSASISGHYHDHSYTPDVGGVDYIVVGSVQKKVMVRLIVTGPGRFDFTVEKINVP